MNKFRLLIIDPQNDFCDIPNSLRPEEPLGFGLVDPALPVTGAHEDMLRLGEFIRTHADSIDDIQVTLDSHNPVDIGHPSWWVDQLGRNPEPFTMITPAHIAAHQWQAADPAMRKYTERYINTIGSSMVWPEHCLVGSWGHNIHYAVLEAINTWARSSGKVVDFVWKGLNPKTEHYSAVQAVLPDPEDAGTVRNQNIVQPVINSGLTVVAGEALSHCVASTVSDIVDGRKEIAEKLLLLTDCMSSVTGFEATGEEFVARMTVLGMKTSTSVDFK